MKNSVASFFRNVGEKIKKYHTNPLFASITIALVVLTGLNPIIGGIALGAWCGTLAVAASIHEAVDIYNYNQPRNSSPDYSHLLPIDTQKEYETLLQGRKAIDEELTQNIVTHASDIKKIEKIDDKFFAIHDALEKHNSNQVPKIIYKNSDAVGAKVEGKLNISDLIKEGQALVDQFNHERRYTNRKE